MDWGRFQLDNREAVEAPSMEKKIPLSTSVAFGTGAAGGWAVSMIVGDMQRSVAPAAYNTRMLNKCLRELF